MLFPRLFRMLLVASIFPLNLISLGLAYAQQLAAPFYRYKPQEFDVTARCPQLFRDGSMPIWRFLHAPHAWPNPSPVDRQYIDLQ